MDASVADAVVGCCDGYERGQIRGWAWFPNRPHESVVVQVCLDGAVMASGAR